MEPGADEGSHSSVPAGQDINLLTETHKKGERDTERGTETQGKNRGPERGGQRPREKETETRGRGNVGWGRVRNSERGGIETQREKKENPDRAPDPMSSKPGISPQHQQLSCLFFPPGQHAGYLPASSVII